MLTWGTPKKQKDRILNIFKPDPYLPSFGLDITWIDSFFTSSRQKGHPGHQAPGANAAKDQDVVSGSDDQLLFLAIGTRHVKGQLAVRFCLDLEIRRSEIWGWAKLERVVDLE